MRFLNPDSKFSQALNRVADIVTLNLLVIACSAPIITIGAAVTAMYDALFRLYRGEGHLYRNFFKAFRSNFKQATIQWLLLLVTGAALVLSIFFYLDMGSTMMVVSTGVLLVVWGIIASWTFPLQFKFQNTVRGTMSNAFMLGIHYLPRTLVMVVVNLLPFLIAFLSPATFLQFGFLWIIGWFAMSAEVALRLLKKPFQNMGVVYEEDFLTEKERDSL